MDAARPVPVVTIDGPSGSGKGTISREVARHLGWHLLDSGALYRLVALSGSLKGLTSDDVTGHAALARAMSVEFSGDERGGERIRLDRVDVTREVRSEETGQGASASPPGQGSGRRSSSARGHSRCLLGSWPTGGTWVP